MADRIIKPDSGNDVVIQNNGGTRKIEVTNSGDVEVTGDVKTTTVKASNLKANDGTASIEIADSSGDVGFSGNTDAKIKLPSAGGIYESDGSTEILKEASGSVTLKNVSINSSVSFPAGGTGNPISVAVISERQNAGTQAGTNSAGWNTRDLNNEISDDDGIVSIASKQFTLGAGTYYIEWSCTAYKTNTHQSTLYDVTNTAHLISGTSEDADNSSSVNNRSYGSFVHTITSNNIYEIRHWTETAQSGNGLGVSNSSGEAERYTIVTIIKLK